MLDGNRQDDDGKGFRMRSGFVGGAVLDLGSLASDGSFAWRCEGTDWQDRTEDARVCNVVLDDLSSCVLGSGGKLASIAPTTTGGRWMKPLPTFPSTRN